MKKNILESPYKEYFLDVDIKNTFWLDGKDSEEIWSKYIKDNSPSYVKLPEDNWLIKGKQEVIGEWLDDFNSNNNKRIEILLRNKVSWDNNDIIWYCVSKKIIVKSTWYEFTKNWNCFFLCDDEFPIIVCENNFTQGLLITPTSLLILIE